MKGPFALKFVRYFNSFSNQAGAPGVGVNWTHTYSRALQKEGDNVIAFRADGRSIGFTLVSGLYVADSTEKDRLERITTPSLGWKLTNADDEVETYDDSGRLLSISNRASDGSRHS